MSILLKENNTIIHYQDTSNINHTNLISLNTIQKRRMLQYYNPIDQEKYLARHVFLNNILLQYLDDPQINYADSGKAYLENSKVKFSLSKTNNHTVIGVNNHNEIGIDIEEIQPIHNFWESCEVFLHQLEINEIRNAIPKLQLSLFYSFWTAKEALVKAIGTGLTIDVKKIQFTIKNDYLLEIKNIELDNISQKTFKLKQFLFENKFISLISIEG